MLKIVQTTLEAIVVVPLKSSVHSALGERLVFHKVSVYMVHGPVFQVLYKELMNKVDRAVI